MTTTFTETDAMGTGMFLIPTANGDLTFSFNLASDVSDPNNIIVYAPDPNDTLADYLLLPDAGNLGDEVTFNYIYPNDPDLTTLQYYNINFYVAGQLSLSIVLPDGIVYQSDTDTLMLSAYINLVGILADDDVFNLNNYNDVIHGAAGNDIFHGNGGPDQLFGDAGADTIYGGSGNDLLTGGSGRDVLRGDSGTDRFDFNSTLESRVGSTRDVILDFHHTEHDRIDLATIDANTGAGGNQAFVFIGADSFAHYHSLHPTVIGMVRYSAGTVQGNVNGNLAADFEIHLNNVASLTGADFFL